MSGINEYKQLAWDFMVKDAFFIKHDLRSHGYQQVFNPRLF